MTDWPGDPPRELDELKAFDAMCVFLEAYWRRGGAASEDIAVLLSSLSRDVRADGMPGDPALWNDWREAVDEVVGKGS